MAEHTRAVASEDVERLPGLDVDNPDPTVIPEHFRAIALRRIADVRAVLERNAMRPRNVARPIAPPGHGDPYRGRRG